MSVLVIVLVATVGALLYSFGPGSSNVGADYDTLRADLTENQADYDFEMVSSDVSVILMITAWGRSWTGFLLRR